MPFKLLLTIGIWAGPIFAASPALEITLKHNSPGEVQTRQQLERLAQSYPLTPWYFTRAIEIDETAIPHSHPVLTLHTRHLKDDDLLLSSFVHEQIHWFLADQKELSAAEDDLGKVFPRIPIGFPDGAENEESGYPSPGQLSGVAFRQAVDRGIARPGAYGVLDARSLPGALPDGARSSARDRQTRREIPS